MNFPICPKTSHVLNAIGAPNEKRNSLVVLTTVVKSMVSSLSGGKVGRQD